MSNFKAKYQALQVLQRLASGEKLPDKGRSKTLSPRKPGVRSADDILKEKYTELAELVALQHLEKQAVLALQKMYVSPPKEERRSRRRRRDEETGRRRVRKGGGGMEDSKKQRPLSASSISSYSSVKSHSSSSSSASRLSSASNASRASSMSNASSSSTMSNSSRASTISNSSRASTMSNSSRASTMSNSSKTSTNSSRSSSKSKASSTPKPVERHFVTIVEEEEEVEIVDQDEIDERQIVKFDEKLAQENEEEAKLKKEASKRTRKVSFVLETQEHSSDDEDDPEEHDEDVLENMERVVPGEESSYSPRQHGNKEAQVNADHTPRYIEIENSLLREILSPRSPRRGFKLSPRSDDVSPTRDKSKSPRRRHRSPSPKRAWEAFNSIPLPPRPVKDIKPCDHKLSNTDNPEIKKWLRHKNALIRRERKAELKKEREEQRAAESAALKKLDRVTESEEFYHTWMVEKKRELRRQRRNERKAAKEQKKIEEEERTKREELFREKQRLSVASFGEKVPSPRREKIKKSGKGDGKECNSKGTGNGKGSPRKKNFPSSNPFKGISYDEWVRQKMRQDEINKKKEKQKQTVDPDLEDIIPNFAKERIERAKTGKGHRVDTGLRKDKDERPECDRVSSEKTETAKPYTWASSETGSSTQKKGNINGVAREHKGLQRPSTARNHVRNAARRERPPSARSDKTRSGLERPPSAHSDRVRGGFSPSFARPEPQGSESNDDHSEHSAHVYKSKPSGCSKTDGHKNGNNGSGGDLVQEKSLVRRNQTHPIADPKDLSIFLTEFDA